MDGTLNVAGNIETTGLDVRYTDDDREPSVVTGAGGDIDLTGSSVTVSGNLTAIGSADSGGNVAIVADTGFATVAGNIIADTTSYFDTGLDGGTVEIKAPGAVNVSGAISTGGEHATPATSPSRATKATSPFPRLSPPTAAVVIQTRGTSASRRRET